MDTKMVLALREAGVDTEGALRRFGGKSELYERFLMKFLSDENFSQIGPALSQQNWEGALMAAHTLKGVSANLGMNRLYKACSAVVDLIRADQGGQAQAAFPELEEAYRQICDVLSAE